MITWWALLEHASSPRFCIRRLYSNKWFQNHKIHICSCKLYKMLILDSGGHESSFAKYHRPTGWDICSHRNSYSLAWHAVKDVVQGLAQSSNLQVSSKHNRSGRLINFLENNNWHRCQIAGGCGDNVRNLCYKWVQICLRALSFQFSISMTWDAYVILTCWSHCCSSSVSSSKCITASTWEPTENIWANMVQITINIQGQIYHTNF